MTEARLDHRMFRQALRAPRVAVVVDGSGPWQHWARLALDAVSGVWGGAGFVLVPHRSGKVEPRILQAVSAYDPDYVVLFRPTLRQYDAALPGSFPLVIDGADAAPDVRAGVLAGEFGAEPLHDPSGEAARDLIAAAASPYRRRPSPGEPAAEAVLWLDADGPPPPLAPVPPHAAALPAVGVPQGWSGDAALALTARLGSAGAPTPGGAPDGPADDDAFLWLVETAGAAAVPPQAVCELLDPPHGPYGPFNVLDRTRIDLELVGRPRHAPATLLVIGGEPEDFAIALLWDRMFGAGVWLPPGRSPDGDGGGPPAVRAALRRRAVDPSRRSGPLLVASVSRQADVDAAAASLGDGLRDRQRRRSAPVAAFHGSFDARRALHLAVAGHWDEEFAVPVHRPDRTDFAMSAPPPPPLLRNDRLSTLPELPYEVDLQVQGGGLPAGRGLDGARLLTSAADLATTWIRSGRDGVAYHARRDGIVLAGASEASRLARPRVQEPDLLAWADAVAEPRGLRFRLSDAGLRVEILTRLAGGRSALCHLLAGPMLPALRACLDRRPTAEAFPDGDGLVLTGGHGLLRYAGIAARSAEPAVPDVAGRTRGLTDELLTRRLLRRGLVLGCALCQRPSFVAVDDVAQTYSCSRCGAHNELVHGRWRRPADEPVWHYDLHPAVRELLGQHGDVPLLLSAWLRSRAAGYSDAAEIEMHPPGRPPVAEADLLAHADGRLIVAEAKSNDALGQTGRKTADAAAKKARIAATLRADQLVLATRAAAWSVGSVDAARHALRTADWPDGRPAALRLITGLGGPHNDVADNYVDLDTGAATPWSDR